MRMSVDHAVRDQGETEAVTSLRSHSNLGAGGRGRRARRSGPLLQRETVREAPRSVTCIFLLPVSWSVLVRGADHTGSTRSRSVNEPMTRKQKYSARRGTRRPFWTGEGGRGGQADKVNVLAGRLLLTHSHAQAGPARADRRGPCP